MSVNEGLQRAGDISIEQLSIITSDNYVVDLADFFVELNIYEDIFSNYMYGTIVITDSRNLIENFNIHGEEFLNVKLRTPTFSEDEVIQKTFRVFRLTDREIVRDTNTQNYTLHFVSTEVFYDVLLPLFAPFEGDITEVVGEIFSNYIAASRNFDVTQEGAEIKENPEPTKLIILTEASNKVKFISPGWSPFKCINWLATKSLPKDDSAKNFIFFESNKNFYFGSLESLFKNAVQNDNYLGKYTIAVSNTRVNENTSDLNREMFLAKDVTMSETTDYIKNYTNGYLSNRLIFLDVYNKDYQQIDYDHVDKYKDQFHVSGSGISSIPVFSEGSFRNPATHISFYPKNPKLFDDFTDNVNEKMDEIYGNRLSSMLELTNIKMNVTIPGRTDAEVGRLLYFNYPALGGKTEADKESDNEDKLYSGYYFITAIRHKVTRNDHSMVMELVKDSLFVDRESFNNTNVKNI
jgi:hypothetical protein